MSRFIRKHAAWLLSGSLLLAGSAFAQLGDTRPYTPITDEILNNPSDSDWPQYRRTHDNWAFSPLDQISKDNVRGLTLAWSRAVPAGAIESTPLVYEGIMFLVNPDSSVQAVDATNGNLIWHYVRELPEGVNPSGYVRNIALYDDKVYYSSRDGYLVAINAATGQVEWESFMGGPELAIVPSSGPIAANGVIVTGRSCGLFSGVTLSAGGCFVLGHDADTGEMLWRVNTIAAPGEPGGDTWGDLPIESRYHVSPWGTASYDPELNLIYIGTGVPGPYPSISHGRDNQDALYSNSTLAIDATTGELSWYYQHLPADDWDIDHTSERILIDVPIDPGSEVEWVGAGVVPGETRQIVWTAGKSGVQFVLDRNTGEFLWGSSLLHQNLVLGIDPDGRVQTNGDLWHKEIGETVIVGQRAAKNWWAGTYSPLTNGIYQPLHNAWLDQTSLEWTGQGLGAMRTSIRSPVDSDYLGMVKGYNVTTGDLLWEQKWPTIHSGGLVSTAGGLVFGGDFERYFRAYDDTTGEVLWSTILNSRISGGAISYEVDGVQYIAVTTGGGTLYDGTFNLTDRGITSPSGSNTVFVFALGSVLHGE